MSQIEIKGGVVTQETLKSYDGSRWTVVAGVGKDAQEAVDNLYDLLFEMFPEEIGPLLQGKGPRNYIQITETAQNAFAVRVDKGRAYFAKQVVKDRLGAEEIDEEDERPARRSRREDPQDEVAERRARRQSRDDDDEDPPQRRSYGRKAVEPSSEYECDHGERNFVDRSPKWKGYMCSAPQGTRQADKCPPLFWNKKEQAYLPPED